MKVDKNKKKKIVVRKIKIVKYGRNKIWLLSAQGREKEKERARARACCTVATSCVGVPE